MQDLGIQARAGSCIERVTRRKPRSRGEYRLEKVTPEVTALSLFYRDDFWWERRRSSRAGSSCKHAATAIKREVVDVEAGPTIHRELGETGRGPDGKRRKLASAHSASEVIVLSD